MRRMTRYVLAELLLIFLVTLTGMTMMLLLVGVAQEAVRQGLGPQPVLRLIPYILPNALRFAVPGTMLFAACSVFGRMSASNEVTAVKSVGISPMALIWPAFTLAFVVSLAAVWLNDIAVSWGRCGVQRVVLESVEQIAYGMLRTKRSYATEKFSISVQRVDGRKLMHPTLTFQLGEDPTPMILLADHAELRLNPDRGTLSIIMYNARLEGRYNGEIPDRFEHEVALTDASRSNVTSNRPSDLPLRDIQGEVELQRERIRDLKQTLAVDAAFQMATGDFEGLMEAKWQTCHLQLEQAVYRLSRLYTEPWRRWANGFSCFFFVMVGTPLAIRLRTADVWTSFGACFLPILCVYYPLMQYGAENAKCGALPPYTVWLGNAVLAVVGFWQLRRVTRY